MRILSYTLNMEVVFPFETFVTKLYHNVDLHRIEVLNSHRPMAMYGPHVTHFHRGYGIFNEKRKLFVLL